MATIDPLELKESRFADTQVFPGVFPLGAVISLAKVVSEDKKSRAWRVTFARLDRADGRAPNLDPLFAGQSFNYTAGQLLSPGAVPPRRDNPVFGSASPGNDSDVEPLFLQVAWGMSGGKTCRMLAHWPAMGGSVVVEGSYVEAFAGGNLFSIGNNPPLISTDEFPAFSAHITPIDGLASKDAGELSIQQIVDVAPAAGQTGIFVDGIGTGQGFDCPSTIGSEASMLSSTVFGVGPYTAWNAILQTRFPQTRPTLYISTVSAHPSPPAVAMVLQDNAKFDAAIPTGEFVPSVGDVAIRINADITNTAGPTIGQLEALINTSAIIRVGTPSSPGVLGHPLQNFATSIAAPDPDPTVGLALFTAATQGGAVYVPDFARRVRINLVTANTAFVDGDQRVPLTGPPATQIVFYDDQGLVVDAVWQGVLPSNNGVSVPEWLPVPARAVMVGIYADPGLEFNALVHWRIAP